MNCPICNVTLQMKEEQGKKIVSCPNCRYVEVERSVTRKTFAKCRAEIKNNEK